MRADPGEHGSPDPDEGDEGGCHGGQRPADEHARGDAEREARRRRSRWGRDRGGRNGRRERAVAMRSNGLDHQVTIRVRSPAAAIDARPTSPSLVASQRVRLTLWVQASRNVRFSSSRATRGAPQKIPMSAGATRTTCPSCWRRRSFPEEAPVAVAAVAVRRAGLHRGVVEVDEVRAGDRQSDRDRSQQAEHHSGWRAELPPGQPDQGPCSLLVITRAGGGPTRSRGPPTRAATTMKIAVSIPWKAQ